MMLLHEDDFVPDTLEPLSTNPDIVIGERTGFAFFLDHPNNRKILIGVNGVNTKQNNWVDGPHDQMPDNYIYTGQIPNYQKYLEENYPNAAGKIDAYGHYIGQEDGARIAVGPYLVYFSALDLYNTVEACKPRANRIGNFYTCITQQVYGTAPTPHL